MTKRLKKTQEQVFIEKVIEWYRRWGDHDLPWRATKDPWKILIAAIMLRKTTTKQVMRVYPVFIKKFPSPKELSSASESEIRKIIRPLGMEHQRSKLLKNLAEALIRKFGGSIPKKKDDLILLPGVKQYIASEVLCVAYGVPEPMLDRNMVRIIERVFAIRSKKRRPHTDPYLWKFASSLIPKNPSLAKEFNWGILDLGRKICRPRNPKCSECPVKTLCKRAFR